MTQNAFAMQRSDGSDDSALHHATHINTAHRTDCDSTGWAVAAPEGDLARDSNSSPGTHSETAGNFFDVVFLSVALVAYSPGLAGHQTPSHTHTYRDTLGRGGFVHRGGNDVYESHQTRESNSVRFPRVSSDTWSHSDSADITALRISVPPPQNLSLPICPTGPPRLPSVAVRGWTSRYA